MICTIALSLVACGDQKGNTDKVDNTEIENVETDNSGSISNTESGSNVDDTNSNGDTDIDIGDTSDLDSTTVSIKETVVYEKSGLKITAKKLETHGLIGPCISFEIENSTDRDLTIVPRESSVNGYTISSFVMGEYTVPGNTTGTHNVYFSSTELETAGITTLANFRLKFQITEGDTLDGFAETEFIEIPTSEADSYTNNSSETGINNEANAVVVYDKDGIKLTILGLQPYEAAHTGEVIGVELENNSDKYVGITFDNPLLNGFVCNPAYDITASPGETRVETITFQTSNYVNNGITKIESFSAGIILGDLDNKTVIDRADPFTVEF